MEPFGTPWGPSAHCPLGGLDPRSGDPAGPWTPFPFPAGCPWDCSSELSASASVPRSAPLAITFFLSDSLSFPVSSSHLLSALPSYSPILSFPPPARHSCCLAHSIYSGVFRVITIKLLKGDNPAKEASLIPSPLLSLVWCSPAPPSPEASCFHLTPFP